MNIKEIRELIQLLETSAIEEFEMERSGVRVRIRKRSALPGPAPEVRLQPAPGQQAPEIPPPAPEAAPATEAGKTVFKAPIVGTFYITPKPDAEPFVKVGDPVSKGTVLCIIEAMKIFNQIESDVEGLILRILVENGQPVEYGQPLFEIRTAN